jgi:hypothetical protein
VKSQSNFTLESQAASRRTWQELENHQTKKRSTGIAHHFLVGKVLDICLCDTAGIATDRPLVYGERQGITQPASASNIPIPRANPAQRCGVRCVEDDPSRRTPERSSDDYHPPDRSSQYGNAVFDFPA